MYRRSILALALATALWANAQLHTHQVVVLNEGYFDMATQTQVQPVTLGSYDPATAEYSTVATIPGVRFGNHVAVDNGVVYVAADHKLLAYDADTYALLDEAEVQGIRRFAFGNGLIVITRGELGGLSHYCEVRDKATLDLLYTVDLSQLPYSAEGVVVAGDKAYLAVNNGFDWANLVGYIGVLDLTTGSWEGLVDLGAEGLNPEHLMVKDGAVYSLNNTDFTHASISKLAQAGGALEYTTTVAASSGCGSSALVEDKVYFMEYAQGKLNRFDLATATVLDTLEASPATYGLLEDPHNGVLYGTTTDFFSSGELHVMDLQGNVLSTVAVGVSPGHLALDERSATGVHELATASLTAFPSPAQDVVNVVVADGQVPMAAVVLDPAGRTVAASLQRMAGGYRLQVDGLNAGVYTVRLGDGRTVRFIKG